MEQGWEGVSGDELEGDFWAEGLPSCTQSQLEYYRVHNLLCQFVPVLDYSNAERMLKATGSTPLLEKIENVTSKPKAGGGTAKSVSLGKLRRPRTFLYIQIRSPRILLWNRKRAAGGGELPHMGHGAALL